MYKLKPIPLAADIDLIYEFNLLSFHFCDKYSTDITVSRIDISDVEYNGRKQTLERGYSRNVLERERERESNRHFKLRKIKAEYEWT